MGILGVLCLPVGDIGQCAVDLGRAYGSELCFEIANPSSETSNLLLTFEGRASRRRLELRTLLLSFEGATLPVVMVCIARAASALGKLQPIDLWKR